MNSTRDRLVVSVAAVILISVTAMLVTQGGGKGRQAQDGAAVSGDLASPQAVAAVSEEEALQIALQLFPSGHDPHSPVATLVTGDTVTEWTGISSNDGIGDTPHWIVGILGSGLTEADSATYFGVSDDGSLSIPVDGLFFGIDSHTGRITNIGSLSTAHARSYDSLLTLPTANPTQ